jgi:probable rRNA maturation factor
MIQIQLAEEIAAQDLPALASLSYLEQAALATLLHSGGAQGTDLTIVITTNAQLQELNRQYLGIDSPTDVLSFPSGEVDPESEALYLGDILISYPRALAQAGAAGHPVQAELQLLVVHGALHLLGFDHAEEVEKARMWKAQEEILKQLDR